MRIRKILVPTDFSQPSEQALQYAVSLARDSGATIVLVNVVEPVPLYGDSPFCALRMPSTNERQQELNAVEVDPTIPTERHVLLGMAAERIIDEAVKDEVDLIVMSTHGRTGLARVLMGSVAEIIVRRAPCPVLTLKVAVPVPAVS